MRHKITQTDSFKNYIKIIFYTKILTFTMGGDRIEAVNSPSTSTDTTNLEVRPVESIAFFENYYSNLRITSGSMGIDLHAYLPMESEFEPFIIQSGETKIVPTDIKFKFPPRLYGLIKDRSSMAAKGIVTRGGVIDNDYTGEIKVILFNTGSNKTIHHGDKIAQLIIMKYPKYQLNKNPITEPFPKTERGEKGFGEADENKWTAEEKAKWLIWFKHQRQWKEQEILSLKNDLLKIDNYPEWKEFAESHGLQVPAPWFIDDNDEIQHDIALRDAMIAMNETSSNWNIESLFKEFNEKANQDIESNLNKKHVLIDLDSDEDEKQWQALKKRLSSQNTFKDEIRKEKEEALHKRDEEYRAQYAKEAEMMREQSQPSSSRVIPTSQNQIISETRGPSWAAWKEQKIKSGKWIDDPEEYKRQQEEKGLVKRTYKTKDGRYYSRWIKRPRLENEEDSNTN